MENVRKQLVDKISSANHVLVTVSRNPSVDQLASCIATTLVLNKLGKHATAVFSGEVPSTLEFLKPEDTLEKNTDSLRDFIIALDKGKADKLRYKVEDNVVRIFITPYKTSITEQDLDFSQGDFNVDVVIALGVEKQEDLDEAITAHGRILHDATVATLTTGQESSLGSINWNDPKASSLCELVTELTQVLGNELLDNQVSTALLTGIVAETQRFSNDKTTPQTMSMSAALMAAGANQQLVASKLDEPTPAPSGSEAQGTEDNPDETPVLQENTDGALDITHASSPEGAQELDEVSPELAFDSSAFETSDTPKEDNPPLEGISGGGKLITEPPTLGGQLTANSEPEALDPTSDPLSLPAVDAPLLDHTSPRADEAPTLPELPKLPDPVITGMTPPPPAWVPPTAPGTQTLSEIEASVHAQEEVTPPEPSSVDAGLDAARDEVLKALGTSDSPPVPEPAPAAPAPIEPMTDDPELAALLGQPIPTMPIPGQMPPAPTDAAPAPQVNDPNAPPPVPPPIPFNFGGPQAPAA
ncbi:MAG: hypothetical protein JWO41_81 [Candidatus Saccharibacteria bacterium]|nr:hypothetical protein [Candidatus Saccharibacteria bacterium]